MKIRNLLIFVTSAIILVSMVTITAITVVTIKKQGQADIETYRTEELDKVSKNLKNLVDSVHGYVEHAYKTAPGKNAVLVKKAAFAAMRNMRYENGTGYFWVNDTILPYPSMLMHPTLPELEGTLLDDPKYNCALGKNINLFQAFVAVCTAKGEGFVDYFWPKPTKDGLSRPVPKLSFVKLFKPWGWIIGTGVYIDDIDNEIAKKTSIINDRISTVIRRLLLISALVLLAGITVSILIAKRLTVSISGLADSIGRIKKEGIYSGESPVVGTVETRELGAIFNSMLADLRAGDAKNKALVNELAEHNRTLEHKVAERTSELQLTLTEVREANDKILNGIRYAKMIQGSLLPDRDAVMAHLPNSLFIWMPKDIVGGDIYFAEILDHGYVVAIVDCTGHGVPGAFMTMIASSSLKKIINEDRCHDPGEILKRLNRAVKSLLLTSSGHELFDVGMDAAVCVIKPQEKILEFSGAGLPLYCISGGKVEVIKGDRHSIGYKDSSSDFHFNTVNISIKDDMSFFLSTDGFVDQTGGDNGFSFGNRRFRELLNEICKSPFHLYREMLLKAFNEHIGDNERLDDVTVIGFSIGNNSEGNGR